MLPGARPGRTRAARRGFTLAELVIVVAVVGVLTAAILLMLDSGRKTAGTVLSRRAAEEDVRSAAEGIEGFVSAAGLAPARPQGLWHPIVRAEPCLLVFVSKSSRSAAFMPEDTVTIECGGGGIEVADGSGAVLYRSPAGVAATLSYFDCSGAEVAPADLLTDSGRDRIRRIEWHLEAECGDGAFEQDGFCSPPNLMLR